MIEENLLSTLIGRNTGIGSRKLWNHAFAPLYLNDATWVMIQVMIARVSVTLRFAVGDDTPNRLMILERKI